MAFYQSLSEAVIIDGEKLQQELDSRIKDVNISMKVVDVESQNCVHVTAKRGMAVVNGYALKHSEFTTESALDYLREVYERHHIYID